MKKVKVIKPPKEKFTWTGVLLSLEVEAEPLRVDYEFQNSVCARISGSKKLADKEYKTWKEVEGDKEYLRVKRIA